MELGLKDKVALVTGAGSQTGFGRATAVTLAKEGCDVIAADMYLEGAEKTAAFLTFVIGQCFQTGASHNPWARRFQRGFQSSEPNP